MKLLVLAVLAIAAAIALDFALFVLRETSEPEPEWGAADPRLWEVRAAA